MRRTRSASDCADGIPVRSELLLQASCGDSAPDRPAADCRLAAGQEGKPRRLGWADGVADARACYPKGKGTGTPPDAAQAEAAYEAAASGAAAGREETRQRASRRA